MLSDLQNAYEMGKGVERWRKRDESGGETKAVER